MDEGKVREWVLEQTTARFFQDGFTGLTMDAVAEDAGISKKTLYRLIPSKADLFKAIIGRQIESVERKLRDLLDDSDLSFQEKLDGMLREASNMITRLPKNAPRMVMKMGPDVWEMLRTRRAAILDSLVELLDQGRESGLIRNDIPAPFLAKSLHAVIDTLLTPQMAVESGMDLKDLLNLTLTMVYGGILTEPGRLAMREYGRI